MAGEQLTLAKRDPHIADHLEWIGFVRPTGLVVSAPALVSAGVILNRRDAEGQQLLNDCVEAGGAEPTLPDFRTFANRVLGWNFSPRAYSGTEEAPIPLELEATLPDSGGILRPDFAVRVEPTRGAQPAASSLQVRDSRATYQTSSWQLLVCTCQPSEAFDQAPRHRSSSGSVSDLSPHSRMERLRRETGTPAGLLFNGRTLRLISTPKGENSGWLEFRVGDMLQTAGRPISTAMRELLGQNRLLSVPREKRLAALLENSRKYQNEVSERLAVQVLHAL